MNTTGEGEPISLPQPTVTWIINASWPGLLIFNVTQKLVPNIST